MCGDSNCRFATRKTCCQRNDSQCSFENKCPAPREVLCTSADCCERNPSRDNFLRVRKRWSDISRAGMDQNCCSSDPPCTTCRPPCRPVVCRCCPPVIERPCPPRSPSPPPWSQCVPPPCTTCQPIPCCTRQKVCQQPPCFCGDRCCEEVCLHFHVKAATCKPKPACCTYCP